MSAARAPHLLHVFATFAPGGPQVRTTQIMTAFGGEYRHSVLAMDGRTDARELLPPSLDVRILEPLPAAGSLGTTWALRSLVARERPDVLLTYNWGAIEALLAAMSLAGLPVIHHEDGFREDEAGGDFKRRRILFRRMVLPRARTVIMPSRVLERIALDVWRQPKERLRFIANGIRTERFDRRDGNPALRAELGIPTDAPLLGSVGHLRPEKNHGRLLDVLAATKTEPATHLLVLGDGVTRPSLEERARAPDLAGRVHFAGHREDLAPYYRAMDVFVISSDTEQMPVSLLEAMASELPVVSTRVGDVGDMLSDEQQPFVVPLGDDVVPALARAVETLVADPALRERLGASGCAIAEERYTFEGMLAAYREAYEAALARRTPVAR